MAQAKEIIGEIHALLEREHSLNLRHHPMAITLEADGTLVLEGEVQNLAAKKIALERAASVRGVTGIADRLRVAPSRRMGDSEIRDHVRNSLHAEPAFAACRIVTVATERPLARAKATGRAGDYIEIVVADGVVTLDGRVESLSHKRLAGLLTWWVPGTRDVVNGVEVDPSQEDSDAEITDAVRMALEKDPIVHSGLISASTRNAVVTLEGVVATEEQSRAAESDAWFIFGVDKVVNRLSSGHKGSLREQ